MKHTIVTELEWRGELWVMKGHAALVVYEKKQNRLTVGEKESISVLSEKHGITLTVNKEIRSAPANIDFTIWGQLREEKSPDNSTRANVFRNVKDARDKWIKLNLEQPVNLVYSNIYGLRNDADVLADLIGAMQHYGVDKIIFIKNDKSILSIRSE